MPLFEIVTRERYSRKKIPAVTLRELEPVTHAVLREYAMPDVGTILVDRAGRSYRVKKHLGNLVLLGNNYGVEMPSGNYLES